MRLPGILQSPGIQRAPRKEVRLNGGPYGLTQGWCISLLRSLCLRIPAN
ncbi:hypothetical protein AYX14_07055 [Cryptococcus neoformans]|nr:hypothetical protein AYX14_07055 [Cryptococcus neoformans var. grubii]